MNILTVLFIFLLVGTATLYLIHKLSKTSKFQLIGEFVTQVDTPEKVVALTYDDGPNPPYTHQLIELLDRLQVKATFFVVGEYVEQYPETVQALISKGHELGNHSYSHPKLIWKRPRFVQSEIERTDRLLRQLGFQQDIHFRAPFGFKFLILPYVLMSMRKKSILWNVDPKDYQEFDSELISNRVLQQVTPGSIILLHDGGSDRAPTVAATEVVVQQLQQQGYQFKTVSELIHYKVA